ncbi:toll/interleukin-1 receptor domain-containing protein [Chryseobacterium cucumeris]|uniref:toll/interleukin-1 receptor domain-containing protein n=1 Tax=Chryseobacterium cucumeris TaxID=1813611 RepID=UPI003D9611AC
MKNLISKQLLSSVGSANLNESISLNAIAEEKRKRSRYSWETSVFLSHKHDEKEVIQQTITLLNKLGIEVYVDWMDSGIPKETNGYTATRIKEKIRDNHKFILLATEAAINSKWCNWELGYGDAFKFHKNIAIMPITNQQDNKFSGSEYLQIYPVITSEYLYTTGTYHVEYNGTITRLEDWLQQR